MEDGARPKSALPADRVREPRPGDRRQPDRVAIVEAVDSGNAELVPDPRHRRAWTLLVDGVAQSYVDLDQPAHLEFGYARLLAAMIDAAAPPTVPLRVLHLGGGALTLPRYVAATRPGARQRVVDADAALMALVHRVLPPPARADLRVDVADARAAIAAEASSSYDVVIADVYRAAQMPASVASAEFAAQVARVLRPRGLYGVNIADLPPLAFSRRQVATLRAVFGDVGVLGAPGMLRGKRFGNVVVVAANRPARLPVARLLARGAGSPSPRRLLHGADLEAFIAGAHPVTDATAVDSPVTTAIAVGSPAAMPATRAGDPDWFS